MDVLTECEVTHEFSGAMVVSVFFLSVFVALLLGDALLTQTALARTLTRNERLERQKQEQLATLNDDIANRSAELQRLLNKFAHGQNTSLGVEHGLWLDSVGRK
tara:strand:- start:1631 stop:1942 length:312 start_codon:yes stop_codon:yes gene_type:complete